MKTNGWVKAGAGVLAYGGAVCLSAALMACGGPATGVVSVRPGPKSLEEEMWRTPATIAQPAREERPSEGGETASAPIPDDPDAAYERGLRAIEAGDLDVALAAFDRVVEAKPGFGKGHTNRARTLLSLGRPREALESAKKGVERDYRSGPAHHVLGRCYHALGLVEQAEITYLDAISQDSGFAWPYNNLGLLRIEQGRCTEAEPLLRRSLEIDGENAVAWNNLGVALERQGRFEEAREAYRTAVAADPTCAKAIASLERLKGVRGPAPVPPAGGEETADRS